MYPSHRSFDYGCVVYIGGRNVVFLGGCTIIIMEKGSRIVELILKKKRSVLSESEKQELDTFCSESEYNRLFVARYEDDTYLLKRFQEVEAIDTATGWENLKTQYQRSTSRRISIPHYRRLRLMAVACFVLVACSGVYLWIHNSTNPVTKENNRIAVQNLRPGSDKAVLVLSDGTRINLDSSKNGKLADQGGNVVVKKDGLITYSGNTNNIQYASLFNLISTPRGAQFKVQLPDGSQAWLNAESSIRFPVNFDPTGRKVEITGEAYFEISKQLDKSGKKRIPFIVSVNGTQVEVLGTHFNINAYANEESIKTTLLEGSVRVTPVPVSGEGPIARYSQLLSPGQQFQVFSHNKSKLIKDADLKEAVAWKDGVFRFNGIPLTQLMRQVERWYDVEVKYEGNVPDREFVGQISKYSNASDVLKMLELTNGVHFELKNKVLIVKP